MQNVIKLSGIFSIKMFAQDAHIIFRISMIINIWSILNGYYITFIKKIHLKSMKNKFLCGRLLRRKWPPPPKKSNLMKFQYILFVWFNFNLKRTFLTFDRFETYSVSLLTCTKSNLENLIDIQHTIMYESLIFFSGQILQLWFYLWSLLFKIWHHYPMFYLNMSK